MPSEEEREEISFSGRLSSQLKGTEIYFSKISSRFLIENVHLDNLLDLNFCCIAINNVSGI